MKKIMRFPREAEITGNAFSMGLIYRTLKRIYKGKGVLPEDRELVLRWYGIESINRKLAKYLHHTAPTGRRVRFPR